MIAFHLAHSLLLSSFSFGVYQNVLMESARPKLRVIVPLLPSFKTIVSVFQLKNKEFMSGLYSHIPRIVFSVAVASCRACLLTY